MKTYGVMKATLITEHSLSDPEWWVVDLLCRAESDEAGIVSRHDSLEAAEAESQRLNAPGIRAQA